MDSILQAEQVTYYYPQNNRGLAPISLNIQPGQRVLIAGPSGCGKSTLARCLTGLIPHLYRGSLEGAVWLDGLRTADTPLWQLAERAGLVFQNPAAQMLAVSVEEEITFGLENLGLSRATIDERLQETLARFGLETMRTRSPQTLSGGEQQKLALAAITARRPPVLVLDEPLSMLDGTAATELVDHLIDLCCRGTTVVIGEHREEYLQMVPGLRTIRMASQSSPGPSQEAPEQGWPDQGKSSPQIPLSPPTLVSVRTALQQLEVTKLTVALGGRPVLSNLSFSLAGGQVVAIVGRNGVGKTTLLRALAGLQKHEGTISIHEEPLDPSVAPNAVSRSQNSGSRPKLRMVFQNADLQLFNGTVRDEILYRVPEPEMALYRWLLEALGLTRYEGVPPLLLSEGEKKRVALAAVLMHGPRHGLLLDEPSLGQDAAHKTMLIRLARALAEAGQLVILTTHDLPLAAQADRLMLLGSDGFVADGPPAEILHDHGAWAQVGLAVPGWVLCRDLPARSKTASAPILGDSAGARPIVAGNAEPEAGA